MEKKLVEVWDIVPHFSSFRRVVKYTLVELFLGVRHKNRIG